VEVCFQWYLRTSKTTEIKKAFTKHRELNAMSMSETAIDDDHKTIHGEVNRNKWFEIPISKELNPKRGHFVMQKFGCEEPS